MEPDISIIALAAAVFFLALLVVLLRSLRLPDEHVHTRNRRDVLRRILLKKKLHPSSDDREGKGRGNPSEQPPDQVH
ncbi:MAG: hypothetical protein JXA18_10565 [Chitinispirillaceae bacterium]|nr:hypothetical protein [Chitinispirillaceae bacterium]